MSTGSPYFLSRGAPRSRKGYSRRVQRYPSRKSGPNKAFASTPGNFTVNADGQRIVQSVVNATGLQTVAWGFTGATGFINMLGMLNPYDIATTIGTAITTVHAAGDVSGGPIPFYVYSRKFYITDARLAIKVTNGGSNPITVIGYPWIARKTTDLDCVNFLTTNPAVLESDTTTLPTSGSAPEQLGVTPYQFKNITQYANIKKSKAFKLYGGQTKTINMKWSGRLLVDDASIIAGTLGGLTRGVMLTARGDPLTGTLGGSAAVFSSSQAEMIISSTTAYTYCVDMFPVHVHDYIQADTGTGVVVQNQIVPQTGAVGAVVYI